MTRFAVVLADYPEPVRTGSHQRDLSILMALRALGPVRVAAFAHDDARRAMAEADSDVAVVLRPQPLGGVAKRAARRARIMSTALGAAGDYPYSWPYAAHVGEAVRSLEPNAPYDAVVVRSYFAPWVEKFAHLGPVHVDAHDAEHVVTSEAIRSSVSRRAHMLGPATRRSVERLMTRHYPQARRIWVPSKADADAVITLVPQAEVVVVPNAVDPGPDPDPPSQRGGDTVLFVGNLEFTPNSEAARELVDVVFPMISAAHPGTRLTVIGRTAGLDLGRPDASHLGEVPDLEPHYRAARLTVLPIRSGAGTRLKVVEAMARGVPVVSTALGVAGLGLTIGRHALAAELPNDLADQASRVLSDDRLADSLAAAARRLVCEQFGPRAVLDSVRMALG